MSIDDFLNLYFNKENLQQICRRLALPSGGNKPLLVGRVIELLQNTRRRVDAIDALQRVIETEYLRMAANDLGLRSLGAKGEIFQRVIDEVLWEGDGREGDGYSDDADEEFSTSESGEAFDEDDGSSEEVVSYPGVDTIRVPDVDPQDRTDLELETFQRDALTALDRALSKDRRAALISIPTGGGKTRTSLEWLFDRFVTKGKRVVWVTHRLDLLDQVHDEIRGLAFLAKGRNEVTVSRYDGVGGGRTDVSGDFVLASAASIVSRVPTVKTFSGHGKELGVLVYDEAHGSVAKKRKHALEKLLRSSDSKLLGLTATPFRSSESGTAELVKLFGGEPVYEVGFSDLIRVGFLARPQMVHQRLRTTERLALKKAEISEMKQKQEVSWSVLSRLARDDARSREIVEHWFQQSARYGKTVVFACSIDHAHRLEKLFQKHGVDARAVHHHLDRDVRSRTLRWFRGARGASVIINVGLLTEGWNVPDTRTVLMARPTLSTGLYLQMIGRGSRGPRVVPGKTSFYVIDCVDNFARHGLQLAGARVAAYLSEPQEREQGRGDKPRKPRVTPKQVEAFEEATEVLALRGLDFSQYQVWGELRWQSLDDKQRSVAVFTETRAVIEEAMERLAAALQDTADWDEVADLGYELDQQGAVRNLDWDDAVDSTRGTRKLPELVPVEVDAQALQIPRLRAELLSSAITEQVEGDGLDLARRATEIAVARSSDVEQAFGGVGQFIVAIMEAQRRELQGKERQPRRPPLTEMPATEAAQLCLHVASWSAGIPKEEEVVISRALQRIYGIRDVADEIVATEADRFRRGDGVDLAAATAILSQRPYPERMILLDAAFRLSIHDGKLDLDEKRRLTELSDALRLPRAGLEEFLLWWRDIGVHHQVVPGYTSCGSCGTTWREGTHFCGECGTRVSNAPVPAEAAPTVEEVIA